MKGNLKFIVFILLLIPVMFYFEQSFTKEFSWDASFNKNDKQPFGCFVFDDVLSSSLKGNYSLSDKTFFQLNNDSTARPKAFLVLSDYAFMDSLQFRSMISLLRKGNKVMFVSSTFSPYLVDSLRITAHNSFIAYNDIKAMTQHTRKRKPLFLCNTVLPCKIYRFYPQICTDFFSQVTPDEPKMKDQSKDKRKHTWLSETPSTVLAKNREGFPVAFSKKVGKGELFLVSTPLLFTNYGILDQQNAGYVFSLLSYMKGMPLVRYDASKTKSEAKDTPLRYFLSQPPLRWSIYLSMFVLILFMRFNAKRRQRIIPVIEPPVNTTLDFIKQIGTLYHQKKDYLGILRKKKVYFAKALKKETYIDIEEEALTMDLCHRLSNKTGMEAEKIYKMLKELELLQYDIPIDEKTLKDYIDRMNEIITNSNK
ncbi:protein of unknown function [Bacteroides luti]|uniref:DUF4350 domain-containing protein n=1 Tax=Bacteroides luti TaxID=1297750 RepID=A0A1M5HCD0_9BACE|nr:DUF4350 domain-containing protein [Bacteroides luti]SHG13620.1 protein of unknown function [Bacteroides luti]